MRMIRHASRLAVLSLFAAAAIVGCATDRAPSAPDDAAPTSVSARPGAPVPGLRLSRADAPLPTWTVSGVRRERALDRDITVEATIGPRGGTLAIREAGFTLEVPRGAVLVPTRFTVTALAGDLLAYDFGPSGSVFPIPLVGTQDMHVTNVRKLPKNAELRLGYFATPSDVDAQSRQAAVAQEQSVEVESGGHRISFGIPHFSGWIIFWRGGEQPDSIALP